MRSGLCCAPMVLAVGAAASALPPGFREEVIDDDLTQAVGVTFVPDGRGFVWEKAGRVWLIDHDGRSDDPVIDIREEVANFSDMGLVGFCAHPDFLSNGYVYLWYSVDYHHLMHFGTPRYDRHANQYYTDTIGRLTRYRLVPDGHGFKLDPDSRFVLVGDTRSDGPAATHLGHHVGTVMFGEDGSLIASVGDGASWDGFDTGGPMPNSSYTAYADGILRPQEDVGVFRAQMVRSLSGKILRLDPSTGNGMPGNPFYNAADPRSPASRVWALGFRNPWRINIRPGSSVDQPPGANPGVIVVGDVMEGTWDELTVVRGGGENCGWPLFEGLTPKATYGATRREHLDAPNPLFGAGPCPGPFFAFHDLIVQETRATPSWPNPCDAGVPIAAETPTFMHARPVLDWYDDGTTRTGTFTGDTATESVLGRAGCPVSGPGLGGGAPLAGVWYTGTQYPETWRGTLFAADYVGGWIHNIRFDEHHRPVEVRRFQPDAGAVVSVAMNPRDGCLYSVVYDWRGESELRRIVWSDVHPPHAVIRVSPRWGEGPMVIEYDATGSTDEDSPTLWYEWTFGDDSPPSEEPVGRHLYNIQPDEGPHRFKLALTVRDELGLRDTTLTYVYVNNSPPKVTITSPADGSTYSGTRPSVVALRADVEDAEHGPEDLECRWDVVAHHNDHTHPDPPLLRCEADATITPEPCREGDAFWYELVLTVTDPLGLSGADKVVMTPRCCRPDINDDGFLDFFDFSDYVSCFEGDACARPEVADFNGDGFVDFFDLDQFVLEFEAGC